MRLVFQYLFLFLILLNCKKESNDYAYIGGEIINPNTNFVVLSKEGSVLDTIQLDTNNRFIYKVNNLKSGLYTFRHGGEIQMVLLEPQDSIMFRLNTFDFDESLVFTGDGDKKNNYLINAFLQNEADEKRIFKFCQLDPKAYEDQIDSLRAIKDSQLKLFQKKYEASETFMKIAQASIDYSYFTSKEIYPFIHFGGNKFNTLKSLPKDFYDYRKHIDYNIDVYKDYFNYQSFLKSTFNNLALADHMHHADSKDFKWNSICYNLDRLQIIDSMITIESVKNDFLYHYTMGFLTKNNGSENNNAILNSFLAKSSNQENNKVASTIVNSLNNLTPGNSFPNVKLLDLNNNDVDIMTLVNRPTVIYFWSHAFYDHFKDSHYKVKELTAKYPEVSFMAINIDDESPESCMSSVKKNRFPCQNEFKFKNPKESKLTLAIYPMTKAIIIDKESKIVNSNANIFDTNFEEQLLGSINR